MQLKRDICGFERIEYEIDDRDRTLDVEVMTPHYRGAHAAAKSSSGFALYFSTRSGGKTAAVATVEALAVRPVTSREITHSRELRPAS